MTIMTQAIEHFVELEHSQVDDRSAENLWVRMVQTPFPYGGCLSSSVDTTPELFCTLPDDKSIRLQQIPNGQVMNTLEIPSAWSSRP